MIRLMLLLCAALFGAMLIGGQDRGQLRFGLMPVKETPALPSVAAELPPAQAAVAKVADLGPALIEAVSFAPAEPVMLPQPATIDAVEMQVGSTPAAVRILFVAAKSVNVREGPGKDFGVVSRLLRGEAVLVVSAGEGPNGWSLIRIEGDGVEGYVASRLLTE